jgi:hypothetical protein
MLKEFEDVLSLGALPPADGRSPEQAVLWQEALNRLPDAPIGEEAAALVDLLPPDETTSFGFAWTLVHAIESSPDWPVETALQSRTWWQSLLQDRAAKSPSPSPLRRHSRTLAPARLLADE